LAITFAARPPVKKIIFTVTNDLTYDQRMHRICNSLAGAGYDVMLVGRKLGSSLPLQPKTFRQKRLKCFFNKGSLFYAEYNARLFFFLLLQKMDCICAIDLDTILPGYFISRLKKTKRIYDAHEYFTEMKELITRPKVQRTWKRIEKFCVPKFKYGYTVSEGLAGLYEKQYGRNYVAIRNLPLLRPLNPGIKREKFLVFQGAVNEARGFEYLIPAMKNIPYKLVICGDGNFMQQLKTLIRENEVEDKIELRGMMLPEDMWPIAQQAALGLGLAEREGLNQLHALPNKFTDYMHAGLPQLTMNYPEYQKINSQFKVSVLLDSLSVELVTDTINKIMQDEELLDELHRNALKAREIYCWQNEEKKLLSFYQEVFNIE
jgi:glycosyltransferase involved in cell wall biosynthesis